jgi:hypothetical protein
VSFAKIAFSKPEPLVDPFGRVITYVRVSVTDRCDFRCAYSMAQDMTFLHPPNGRDRRRMASSP